MYSCFGPGILSVSSGFALRRQISLFALGEKNMNQFDQKEDDLDATYNGKPREKSHGASDEAQLGLRFDLLVSLNVVKGGCVKVDSDKVEVRFNWRLNT